MIEQTLLYREIQEQPTTLARFFNDARPSILECVRAITAQHIDHVVIAARGTSDNAARYAKYVFGAYNQLQVALATPSLYSIYETPIRFGNALVMGISQSGQSPDILSVLEAAKAQGKLTAAITNHPNSPMGQLADIVIDMHAGAEESVAATKTYTASLAAIAALSAYLAEDNARINDLERIPQAVEQTLSLDGAVRGIVPHLKGMPHCVTIGRAFNYATAFELALKLKELTYSVVEPYSSADFLHGPFAILEPGFPVILIAPSGRMSAEMLDFAEKARAREANLIPITDLPDIAGMGTHSLTLPAVLPEWLTPITSIVPGQMLALHLAGAQGHNVDAPRALNKVTKTQ